MRDLFRQKSTQGFARLQQVWRRADPYVGVGAFVAGFAWDALTLVRVDRPWDNAYLAACLVALGLCLALEHRITTRPERFPRLAPHASWVSYAAQFLFGSLFSAYVVFYFKSVTDWQHLLFLALLAGLLLTNEFLHTLLRAERLRVALYWLVAFSYMLFLIPVLTGWAGLGLFTLAALAALLLTAAVTTGMYLGDEASLRPLMLSHGATVAGLFLALAALDLIGVIPPIPLALVDHGIFHEVQWRDAEPAEGAGRPRVIALTYVDDGGCFTEDDSLFRLRDGDTASFFTAVFAPTGMTVRVRHEWQVHDGATDTWVTTDDIDVSTAAGVRGGADKGFRTWSRKQHIRPGTWRVLVHLANGRYLGGQRFEVVEDGGEGERVMTTRIAE